MANTIGHFGFEITGGPDCAPLPCSPIIQIGLTCWSQDKQDGAPIVSPHLMTEAEIDFHINALKADLDAVGTAAKIALRKRQIRS